ncbi:hypothetical protein BSA171_18690 [Bacillus safensis]|nr:hypothetical protein BSA41_18050 [Bacillus safensis]APT55462.1 hypothetical protein BSA171_18690 [Bacillus safensis]CUB17246.1 hypothetical protein BN2127_JRS3_01073 [Bacillus safensis]
MRKNKLLIFANIIFSLVILSLFAWILSPDSMKEVIKIISFALLTCSFIIIGFLERTKIIFIIILALSWIVIVLELFNFK